jgi:hypothetical protein
MRNELVFSTLVLGLLIASPISAADEPVARVPVEEHPADSEARALLDAIRAGGNRPINLNLVSALSPKLARARSAVVSPIRYEFGGAACVTRNNHIADRTTHGGRL